MDMVPWHVLTHAILAWNGITPQDICCSVNDTTTAAVATGRLLGRGEDGNCMMHMCNLVAEHALGKRVCTRNRVIIDELPEIEALRKSIQLLTKYTYRRWQTVANAIFKDTDNVRIHRTQVYEADYNLMLGIKWRITLYQAEALHDLNAGQYGS